MILVLTGTHHQPFDRLVVAAEAIAATTGERVVVQRGASRVAAPHCEVHDWLAPAELAQLADESRVVVSHGGPGSLFLAWDRGRTPVLVPRRPEHGEHVDDHQVRFAERVGDRAVVVWEPALLLDALNAHRDVLQTSRESSTTGGEAFARHFASLVEELVHRRGGQGGVRATLRNILLWLGSMRR